ncbi:cobalamin B12-binding domain-containing protein [Pseudosulfitobacter koreensis]|uniref:B12-binding domain-containing protein n=1 Tax=Pseudosulfitobacter koreensis TaxID=2968472 RepID=A0ABT1YWB8_9RHOB|nr:cobalamin-dependent protein [Pseudosulfitobacter koreense]MCR8825190.1 hypothetical protein [Pseudosulfitobacter koreense]
MPREQNMSSEPSFREPLEYRVYERSQANILRLKERLPEDTVLSLAREVIRRVASKGQKIEYATLVTSDADLEKLCRELLSDDPKAAVEMIAGLRAEGVSSEQIYLKYLAGAARMLGEWWEQDKASFSQVTTASTRMLAIMRGMRHLFEPAATAQTKSAVFASVPGEDHTLGVKMAADLFRKEGWDISLKLGLKHDALVAEIEREPKGIVGLSMSGRHSIEKLSKLVIALHICCPQAYLLVSGQDVEETRPTLALMGFDGIAGSVEEAREQMAAFWERKTLRSSAQRDRNNGNGSALAEKPVFPKLHIQ